MYFTNAPTFSTDLEEIDEQLENIGILFVYTDDETYAAKLKVKK